MQAAARRRRRRLRLLRLAVMLAVIAAGIILVKKIVLDRFISDKVIFTEEGPVLDDGIRAAIGQAGEASGTLDELLKKNPETAEFIKHYPEMKDNPPAETIGDVQPGSIPHLLQWDERWGYQIYGDNMIAVNGCGPTVLSMVAAGLTGDNTITPYKVAKYAEEYGYYEGEAGTSWSLMTDGAQYFGVYGQELGLDRNGIFSALENGNPVICSMLPGDFTTTGHFIVLVGVEDGRIRVNDPNSRKLSDKLWDYETLAPQISNLWVYSKM